MRLEVESACEQFSDAQPSKVSDDQITGSMDASNPLAQLTEAATLWDIAHLHRTAAANGLRVSVPTKYAPCNIMTDIAIWRSHGHQLPHRKPALRNCCAFSERSTARCAQHSHLVRQCQTN